MSIGDITLDAAGAVTEPTSFPLSVPTAEAARMSVHGMLSTVLLPGLRGVMMADGINPIRHIVEDAVYRTGLQAPGTAPTLDPSASKATGTLTIAGGLPSTQEWCQLGKNPSHVWFISEATFPDPTFTIGVQVKMPTSGTTAERVEATLANFAHCVNNTGTHGVDWLDKGLQAHGYHWNKDIGAKISAEVTDDDYATGSSAEITFTADEFGEIGNGYYHVEGTASTNWSMSPNGFMSGGTLGTTPGPLAGTYNYAYSYYRSADQALSGATPLAEVEIADEGEINVETLTDPTDDSTIDFVRVWRTTTQGGILRRVGDNTSPDATDDYLDQLSDQELTDVGEITYDELGHRVYADGHVPRFRVLARYQGRIFGGGAVRAADYSIGTTAVTNGSATVSWSDASDIGHPTDEWEGRYLKVDGDTEEYRVISVDESAETIVIDRVYEGTTDLAATYKILDRRNPEELFWSEPLKPNQWPTFNSLEAITGPDPEGITAMIEHQDALIVFTPTGIWEVTPSAVSQFQARNRYEGVGCISPHSVQSVDGWLYWAAEDGLYRWDGRAAAPTKVSSPPAIEGQILGIDRTWQRVNLAHGHRITSIYDPDERIVSWYVPLDGDSTNRYVLALQLQTMTFSLDTCEDITTAGRVVNSDGTREILSGQTYGYLWHENLSTVDGWYGTEPVSAVTSGSTTSATNSAASWTTDQGLGCPVWQLDNTGAFTRHTIISNTGTVVTFARYTTAPTSTDQLVMGGIMLDLETGRFHLDDPGRRHILAAVRVSHAVDTDGQYFVASSRDQDALAVGTIASGALTESDGDTRFRCHRQGRFHKLRFICIEPGCDPEFLGYEIEVRARDRNDR